MHAAERRRHRSHGCVPVHLVRRLPLSVLRDDEGTRDYIRFTDVTGAANLLTVGCGGMAIGRLCLVTLLVACHCREALSLALTAGPILTSFGRNQRNHGIDGGSKTARRWRGRRHPDDLLSASTGKLRRKFFLRAYIVSGSGAEKLGPSDKWGRLRMASFGVSLW